MFDFNNEKKKMNNELDVDLISDDDSLFYKKNATDN